MPPFCDVFLFTAILSFSRVSYNQPIEQNEDLCGSGDIKMDKGKVFLNFSSNSLVEFPSGCSRAIHVPSGRVKLDVTKFAISSKDIFNIYDGPYIDEELMLSKSAKVPFSVQASGNALFFIFHTSNESRKENSVFEASFVAITEPNTCRCRSILNGRMECGEKTRNCTINCSPGYMDLTFGKSLSCDVTNGKWDKNIENITFSCQQVSRPKELNLQLSFNFENGTCNEINTTLIEEQITTFLSANPNISAKGLCFRKDVKDRCKTTPLRISCQDLPAYKPKILIKITDQLQPEEDIETSLEFSGLIQSYASISFQEVADSAKLNFDVGNKSFIVDKTSFVKSKVVAVCESGRDYITAPTVLGHPVCSVCPFHHFYDNTTRQCRQCAPGTTARQGSRTCQEGFKIVPHSIPCKSQCPPGKGIQRTSYCKWCPKNTYQVTSHTDGSKCVKCKNDTLTPFAGARNQTQCFSPCSKGTFLNPGTAKCVTCPKGTFQEAARHVFLACKSCRLGHFSATPSKCEACPIGHYQDNYRQTSCKKCPEGKTTNAVGAAKCSLSGSRAGSTPDFEFGTNTKLKEPEIKAAEEKTNKKAATIGIAICIAVIVLVTLIVAYVLRWRRLRTEANGPSSLLRMRTCGSCDYRAIGAKTGQLEVLDEGDGEKLCQTNV